jgi:hypothetical protein
VAMYSSNIVGGIVGGISIMGMVVGDWVD